MKTKRKLLIALLSIITVIFILGCKSEDDENSVSTASTTAAIDAKAITDFGFTDDTNTALSSDITATISGTNITATVPSETNVTALVATFTTTGRSVSVGSTLQASGVTANNFSNSVIYTVTAIDRTTQDYIVTVTSTGSSSNCVIGTSIIGNCKLSGF
ncbi:MAG: hypothetical protein KKF98_02810 [Bacteroidetes bacterium]|nr:hypothetical protein [Bacteroidota bacterium]